MSTPTTLRVVRRVAMVVLLVLILARPGFGQTVLAAQASDLEVLVVVDRTKSMDALDHDGDQPRIAGVAADLTALGDDLVGARFAVVTFGGVVRLEQPFTSDLTAYDALIDTLRVERPFDGSGSLVDRPLDTMREVLTRAAEQHPERRRVVVFVSDGENTADGGVAQRSFAGLADLVEGGVVLGYGTEAGGRMLFDDDPSAPESYLFDDETGQDALSRIDQDNLRTIAGQLGVDYVHRERPGDLPDLVAALDDRSADTTTTTGDDLPAARQVTWVFALALLGLALLELRSGWRGLLSARRARGGAR